MQDSTPQVGGGGERGGRYKGPSQHLFIRTWWAATENGGHRGWRHTSLQVVLTRRRLQGHLRFTTARQSFAARHAPGWHFSVQGWPQSARGLPHSLPQLSSGPPQLAACSHQDPLHGLNGWAPLPSQKILTSRDQGGQNCWHGAEDPARSCGIPQEFPINFFERLQVRSRQTT